MAQRNIKSALVSSLSSEKKAVEERVENRFDKFEKAEAVLNDRTVVPEQEPVIRDSFTMPTADYELFAVLLERCMKAGKSVNKSEIVRAGLQALSKLTGNDLAKAFNGVKKVKPGRPRAGK